MSQSSERRMPTGIPYIIGNEAAERFSYYGMRAVLFIYMTKYLMDSSGQPDLMTEQEANVWYHTFSSAVYFLPIFGALLSDIFWGKYKTILNLSIVYCLGHLALAVFEDRTGLVIGLTLIAIGSGGIKPCVSAHVGDQFGESNSDLLPKVFSIFYFSINFGSFFSTLLTPILLEKVGPSAAFGLPGLLMLIATGAFWGGRNQFTAVPPVGPKRYFEEVLSRSGLKALGSLGVLYAFVAVFWSLFDQQGSSWVAQADRLDRFVDLGFVQFELLPSQIQALNPILVMVLIPLCTLGLYPLAGRFGEVTAIRKIFVGFFISAASFAVVAVTEQWLQDGATPSVMWQFLAFLLLTLGEVLISITALEFSYTQAPNAMKSVIMGVFYLSISLGNTITALVNYAIQNPDGTSKLTGPEYFWFFVGLCIITGIGFGIFGRFYKEERYVQDV